MKNKLLKVFSLVLTMSLLIVSSSFVVTAADHGLEAANNTVAVNGTKTETVTVSIVASSDVKFYSLEGTWDVHEQGATEYFTLTGITSETFTFGTAPNYVNVTNGKVLWADLTFSAGTIAQGTKVLTATYSVAANTPAGTYTVRFCSEVFTDAYGVSHEEDVYYTATITVTHVCIPELQQGQKATCTVDGWKDYYTCQTCGAHYVEIGGVKYNDAQLNTWKQTAGKIAATDHDWVIDGYTDSGNGTHDVEWVCNNDASHTKEDRDVDHTYVDGECACGAKEPATGLKGDVNLDGFVDFEDAVLLTRYTMDVDDLENATALANGDVNGDGFVDFEDAVKLTRYTMDVDTLD